MSSKAPNSYAGEKFPAIFPGTSQKVSYTDSSAASSNAFAAGTSIVRVVSTTACFIKFAASPTAATTDTFLPANTPEYFGVPEGQSYKVAAIRLTESGDLYVTEGAPQ
jgi:hypothetical protein